MTAESEPEDGAAVDDGEGSTDGGAGVELPFDDDLDEPAGMDDSEPVTAANPLDVVDPFVVVDPPEIVDTFVVCGGAEPTAPVPPPAGPPQPAATITAITISPHPRGARAPRARRRLLLLTIDRTIPIGRVADPVPLQVCGRISKIEQILCR